MLRLRTLGGLSLDGSEGPLGTAGTHRRRLALFALLVASGERGVSRDKLLAYLWPEADPDRSRRALSEMLVALRRDLHADALFHGTTEVRLDTGEFASDVAQFERALDRRELAAAIELYGGPFLDGFALPDAPEFQRWAERERLRLEQRFRGALEALAADAKAAGAPLEAAQWWSRLAEIDPLSAHVAIEVMSALAAGGDQAGAIAHATAHERRVREEFGAAPNRAVRSFAEKLKADPTYAPPPPPRASAPLRRSTGRVIGAPSERDSLEDAVVTSTTSRERGATIAGRYLIERELGRGGMATVFLAHDLKHDRDVALKFIHAELADAIGTERFQSEIAVLAKLQHPHILPLYDSGEVEGSLFYVMPFVGGESLRERLLRERQLPVPDALRLAREVADALAYAHAQGVIHRDVKPENILLANGHALVADFGIARAVSRAAGRRTTEDGFAVGTPAYMSPEQASGDPIDGRSDEYSLACVLFEMLGGAPPFVGTSGRSVLAQRFTEDAPPVQTVRANVPPEVAAAIQRALQRVPADRYQTVREFGSALDVMDTLGRPRATGARRVAGILTRWKWVIGAAVAVAIAAALFAFRPAPLVPDLYVVLPFQHRDGTAPPLLNGDNCERLIYEEFGRWSGVKLVDDMRAREAMRRYGGGALTLDEALATARSLRAGRLVFGDVWEFADTIRIRGAVYDVAKGREGIEQEFTIRLDATLRGTQEKFSQLADQLLIPRVGSPTAGEGMQGTKNIEALSDYVRGHEALGRWALDSAEELFRMAVEHDADYAYALFWLAQTSAWRGDSASAGWGAIAERAVRAAGRLSARDSAFAMALRAMAVGSYPEACSRYDALVRRDSMDFRAWFGLSECLANDRLVLRDPASPSGWRFRASYGQAMRARARALEVVPSSHRWFGGPAFRQLPQFLYTSPNQLRMGVDSANAPFGAFPALLGDTLVFVPYPFSKLTSGAVETPPTMAAAIERDRQQLLRIARRWAGAYPTSASVYETLGLALEGTGRLVGGADPDQSALAALAHARTLARDSGDARRIAITQTRLLVIAERYDEARHVADSLLLAAADPSAGGADSLKGLAALTGRLHLTIELLRRSAPLLQITQSDGRVIRPPVPVSEAERELMGYVSLGAPVDSMRALTRRVKEAVRTYVPARDAARVRDEVLSWPLTFAFPADAPLSVTRADVPGDWMLPMQRAALRYDSAAVRAQLAALQAERRLAQPGEVSIYWVYLDAGLYLASGDSAGAVHSLDGSLNAMPALGPYLLEYVQESGFLVRAMALRATLAAAAGDTATARHWAGAVVTLWEHADPELEPTVAAMRALVKPTVR